MDLGKCFHVKIAIDVNDDLIAQIGLDGWLNHGLGVGAVATDDSTGTGIG